MGYHRAYRPGRRAFLGRTVQAGALGLGGLALPDLLRMEAAQAAPRREMSCILLWLRGGPSSIDMWDLKPDAPSEIRGEFRPISTNVPGTQISEHLPLLARMADQYALVRSVTHRSDDHELASHINITGWDTWPQVPYPMFGTVVQKVLGYRGTLPPHVHLPEPAQPYTGGQHYLARQDLPFTISVLDDPDLKVKDIELARGLTAGRMERRRALLAASARSSAPLADGSAQALAGDVFQQRAFDVLTSSASRAAFDLTREPRALREKYGLPEHPKQIVAQGDAGDIAPNEFNRSVVGQGLLMARRLVEAGVRFVTVIGRGWDTHADNFNRLQQMLPWVDRGVSTLLADLKDRGLLETTLVVVTGDFNRTPRINKDAGRDHWGHVQTIFLAGAGIPGGAVIGASDEQCAYPAERPIPAADIAATIYHRFGIRPDQQLRAPDDRPYWVLPEGAHPVPELI